MATFKMAWPDLGLEVTCESIAQNQAAFDTFVANLPIKAVQGHEMIGGWILRDHSVLLKKKPFDICPSKLDKETMDKAPVGRMSMLFPQGSVTEVLVKYDDCADDREYVPFAKVSDKDLETLKKAGKAQWKSASRTKEVIVVEFKA